MISSLRNLFTSEVINALFIGEEIIFPADAGVCGNFSFGSYSLDQGNIISSGSSGEVLPLSIAIEGIDFDCSLSNRDGDLDRVASVGSSAVFNLNFFSDDFDRVIANNVLADAPSCPEGIFTLVAAEEATLPRLELILEIACPDLIAQLEESFLGLIDSPEIEPVKERAVQFDSIEEAVKSGERKLVLEPGYVTLLGEDQQVEQALSNILPQLFATPALISFFDALKQENISEAAFELRNLFLQNGVENQSESSDLNTTQIEQDLDEFGVPASDILPLLELFSNTTVDGGLDDITVGEVAALFGENTEIGSLLLIFGRETPFIDVASVLVPVMIALLQADNGGLLLPLLDPVFELVNTIPTLFTNVLNTAFNNLKLNENEGVPQVVLDVFKVIGLVDSSFAEELNNAGDEVTLKELFQVLGVDTLTFDLGGLGTLELEIESLQAALFFQVNPGTIISGAKSIVFPEFEVLDNSSLAVEYEFRLVKDDIVTVTDTINAKFDLSFVTQEAFAPVADFIALNQDFGLTAIDSEEQVPSGLTNFTDCLLEAIGFLFTAQVTNAISKQKVSFANDETGELQPLFALVFDLYEVVGAILIENTFFNLHQDRENQVLTFVSPNSTCRADFGVVEEQEAKRASNAVAIAVPIVVVFIIVSLGAALLVKKRQAKKSIEVDDAQEEVGEQPEAASRQNKIVSEML